MRSGTEDRTGKILLLMILIGSAVRLLLAALTGLGVDESYMVAMARQPSFSYFDHPPFSFWLVRMMTFLTGSEAAFWVRLPFVVLFAGSTWLCFRLGEALFGSRAGWYGALLFNLAPVFTMVDGVWVLPDGPLVFFLLAGAYALVRVFFTEGDRMGLWWWLLAGAATGLGLLSKYTAAFLPLGVFLFILSRRDRWTWLFSSGPWLAVLVAAVFVSPVVIWNMNHGWASFAFQSGRSAGGSGLQPLKFLQILAGQALYLAPWIWLPLLYEMFSGLPNKSGQERRFFLALLGAGPIVLFGMVALWASGRMFPHWSMPGYLMLFPLLGARVARFMEEGRRSVRVWLSGSWIGVVLVVLLFGSHASTGWVRSVFPGFAQSDPALELVDWKPLGDELGRLGLLEKKNLFVAAGRWQDAGKADYALGGALPVLCLGPAPHHYAFIRDAKNYAGWDAVLVSTKKSLRGARREFGDCFADIEPMTGLPVRQTSAEALTLKLYLARDFRPDCPIGRPPDSEPDEKDGTHAGDKP